MAAALLPPDKGQRDDDPHRHRDRLDAPGPGPALPDPGCDVRLSARLTAAQTRDTPRCATRPAAIAAGTPPRPAKVPCTMAFSQTRTVALSASRRADPHR